MTGAATPPRAMAMKAQRAMPRTRCLIGRLLTRISVTPRALLDRLARADDRSRCVILGVFARVVSPAWSADGGDSSERRSPRYSGSAQQSDGWVRFCPGAQRANLPWAQPRPRIPGDVRSDTGGRMDPQRRTANRALRSAGANHRHRRLGGGSTANLESRHPNRRRRRGAAPTLGGGPTRRARWRSSPAAR
jgi:hypothetical protein